MRMMEVDGLVYEVDKYGVRHQLDPVPIPYDTAYVAQHTSKPNYAENSCLLNGLRLGLIVGAFGGMPESLLDYGYGDGSFASFAARSVPKVYVYDIADTPVPKGCERLSVPNEPVDVATFWDSLEHLPNLYEVVAVRAKFLAISVPCAPDSDDHFKTWRHRRPHEHLHHFTPEALVRYMRAAGRMPVLTTFAEDCVRGGPRNILTAFFV